METKINDFGQKIGGAKKDLWKERGLLVDDTETMNDRELDSYVKKPNVWPRPDYRTLVNEGIPIGIAYYIKTVYDSIPTKPTASYAQNLTRSRYERYIETVNNIRKVVEGIKTADDARQAYENFMYGFGYAEKHTGIYIKLSEKGHADPVISDKLIKALYKSKSSIFMQTFEKKAIAANFCCEDDEKTPRGYTVSPRMDGMWYVFKNRYVISSDCKSRKEAVQFARQHAENNKVAQKAKKVRLVPKQLECIDRTGPEYRDRHADGQDYIDTFGFKGGEFGNWLNQNDRQANLDMAYDAFKDIAETLGIKDACVSLNGELSIAFGARGSGNALAHYEPMRRVINLTKLKGAGSLAHEWWHALDDYLGSRFDAGIFISKNPKKLESVSRLMDAITRKKLSAEEIAQIAEEKSTQTKKAALRHVKNLLLLCNISDIDDEMENKLMQLISAYCDDSNNENQTEEQLLEYLNNITEKITDRDIIYLTPYRTKRHIPDERPTDYITNSKLIGDMCSKDGGYWDSPEELTARAFACYLKDRMPYKSDYLVAHAESAFMPDENNNIIRAYPTGEEREIINRAFDELFEDLKRHEILSAK